MGRVVSPRRPPFESPRAQAELQLEILIDGQHPDITAVEGQINSISVALGDGAANFTTPVEPRGILLANDFNNDGKLDVVTALTIPLRSRAERSGNMPEFSGAINYSTIGHQPKHSRPLISIGMDG